MKSAPASAAKPLAPAVVPAAPAGAIRPIPTTAGETRGTGSAAAAAPEAGASAGVSAEQVPPAAEMDELRKFEESAFPRDGAGGPLSEDTQREASAAEGRAPSRLPARPSAEDPPETLRSDDHAAGGTQAAPPLGTGAAAPPEPWLANLALPDIPVRWDPKVIRYLELYRSSPLGRGIMTSWLRRLGRYQKLIGRTLQRHNLPQSLIYVAMIESGFDPRRTSPAGAAGIWQFMAIRSVDFDVRVDYWVDERRNPERSTEAAAAHLKDLYERFGSWELALAAYNAGPGAVIRSMQKYNTNDYWKLAAFEAGLAWETALYVPKVLAAAIVGSNRSFFGYDDITPDIEVSFDLVSVPGSVTLAQAARAAGAGIDAIEQLNPELRRGRTPPSTRAWLRVPAGSADRFYAGIAALKGEIARYKPYLVRLGDTDDQIARRHGTSRARLRAVNGLRHAAELRPGLTILVPAQAPPRPEAMKGRDAGHRAAGQAPANGEAGSASAAGTGILEAGGDAGAGTEREELVIVALPEGSPQELPGRKRVFYRVVIGDTLAEVATHLRVKASELAAWNALDPEARLVSNMVLQAFVPADFDESQVVLLDAGRALVAVAGSDDFLNLYERRKGRHRLLYAARAGDTLEAVGKRFGLSLGDLMRINKLGRRADLRPGQTLVLYVDEAQTRAALRRGAAPAAPASGGESAPTAEADATSSSTATAPSAEPAPAGATAEASIQSAGRGDESSAEAGGTPVEDAAPPPGAETGAQDEQTAEQKRQGAAAASADEVGPDDTQPEAKRVSGPRRHGRSGSVPEQGTPAPPTKGGSPQA